MTDDPRDQYVTRAELQETLKRLEERIEAQRAAFETRLGAQVKRFVSEVSGHIVRISEEALQGRSVLTESNQALVVEFRRAGDRADEAAAASNRHRESTAARLATLEEAFGELSKSVIVALEKQLGEVKRMVQTHARKGRG